MIILFLAGIITGTLLGMIRFENRQMYVFNLSLQVSGWQLNHGQRNPGTFIYFAFENNPPPRDIDTPEIEFLQFLSEHENILKNS